MVAGASGLLLLLEEGRALGLLGPGPVEAHIRHAEAYAEAYARLGADVGESHDDPQVPVDALDLGSGAGVPGLVLALLWPQSRWTLLDAGHRRCDFLRRAVTALDLESRAEVLEGRAEEVGRDHRYRGRFQLVTARGFGSPGVTAECGAPLLAIGGCLLVSEPPEPLGRWPEAGLAEFGLEAISPDTLPETLSPRTPGLEPVASPGEASGRIFAARQAHGCPDRYPRRTGVPKKRPRF